METRPESGASSEKPSGFDLNALVSALAEAAKSNQALISIASAILGKDVSCLAPNSVGDTGKAHPPQVWDASLTLSESIAAFLNYKAEMRKSEGTQRYLREALGKFAKGRANRPLQSITVDEIQDWIDGYDKTKTRQTNLGAMRTFLRWAMKKRYIPEDLTQHVEIPDLDDSAEPDPYTVAETQTLLNFLAEWCPDICRVMAIRFFAGLRSAEVSRMTEENIHLDRGIIEVTRAMSKTRRRRVVAIHPNLRAWLALGGEVRGYAEDTLRNAFKVSGVKKRRNGTRSSFVTYHLGKFEDVAKTAMQAGNSRDMIEMHYKGLCSHAEAEAYFNIHPPAVIIPKPPTNSGHFQPGHKAHKRKKPAGEPAGAQSGLV